MSELRIFHYRKKCIGCNSCAEIMPAKWIMSKHDGKANLVGGEKRKDHWVSSASSSELRLIRESVKACTAGVIKLQIIKG